MMLKYVVYVKEINGEGYPSVIEISSKNPHPNKEQILRYMRKQKQIASAAGLMRDKITNQTVRGQFLVRSDGVYAWTTEAEYYFDKYNIALNDDFVNHVLES